MSPPIGGRDRAGAGLFGSGLGANFINHSHICSAVRRPAMGGVIGSLSSWPAWNLPDWSNSTTLPDWSSSSSALPDWSSSAYTLPDWSLSSSTLPDWSDTSSTASAFSSAVSNALTSETSGLVQIAEQKAG